MMKHLAITLFGITWSTANIIPNLKLGLEFYRRAFERAFAVREFSEQELEQYIEESNQGELVSREK
jgi:hypothetical protein